MKKKQKMEIVKMGNNRDNNTHDYVTTYLNVPRLVPLNPINLSFELDDFYRIRLAVENFRTSPSFQNSRENFVVVVADYCYWCKAMWNDLKRFIDMNKQFINFHVLSNETTEGQEGIAYLRSKTGDLKFPSFFKFNSAGKWINIGQPRNRTPAGFHAWFYQSE